jgi:hypothetical protein
MINTADHLGQCVNPCRWALPIRREAVSSDPLPCSNVRYFSPDCFEDVPTVHTENGMRAVIRMPVKDVPPHLRSVLGSYP